MTLSDRLGLDVRTELILTLAMQVGLAGLAVYGAVGGRAGVAVNASGALGVSLLPRLLRRETGVDVAFGLVLWLTAATAFHAVGTLGPYRNVWWYDHVAHALSASIVAGVAYATVDALDRSREAIYLPEPYRSGVLFVFVLATAVLWEVAEFAATQLSTALGSERGVLVVFGPKDIVTDLVYSGAGGLAVVAWGRGYFQALSEKLSRTVFRGSTD